MYTTEKLIDTGYLLAQIFGFWMTDFSTFYIKS